MLFASHRLYINSDLSAFMISSPLEGDKEQKTGPYVMVVFVRKSQTLYDPQRERERKRGLNKSKYHSLQINHPNQTHSLRQAARMCTGSKKREKAEQAGETDFPGHRSGLQNLWPLPPSHQRERKCPHLSPRLCFLITSTGWRGAAESPPPASWLGGGSGGCWSQE